MLDKDTLLIPFGPCCCGCSDRFYNVGKICPYYSQTNEQKLQYKVKCNYMEIEDSKILADRIKICNIKLEAREMTEILVCKCNSCTHW